MISKDAFKNLVLAGAITVKNTIAVEQIDNIIQDIVDENEDAFPEEMEKVFEIEDKCDFRIPLVHIASSIAEIIGTDKVESAVVKFKYLDAVSLFAFENEEAEHYTDLVYQFFYDPESAVEELDSLDNTLPEEKLYYVRRYVMLRNEMM